MRAQLVTVDGEQLVLLLTRQNWSASNPVERRYVWEAIVSDGETGVEHRRTTQSAPHLQLRWRILPRDADWQTWRDLLGQIGARRVIAPLWEDVVPRTEWLAGRRVNSSQLVVGWTTLMEDARVGTLEALPEGEWLCPAVVGRLEHTDSNAASPRVAEIDVRVTEDRPWKWRVEPAVDAPASVDLKPDWSRVEESSDSYLKFSRMGATPETMVEGSPVRRISQQANMLLRRGEFAQLLAFWCGRRGSAATFEHDSLIKPGTDTPFAPHVFNGEGGRGMLRFSSDVLDVKWISAEWCQVRLGLTQVIDVTAGGSSYPRVCMLYKFYRLDDPSITEYLTDSDKPVEFDGQTWTPARVEEPDIIADIELQNEECKFDIDPKDLLMAPLFERVEIDYNVWVEVLECYPDDGGATTLFIGKARGRSQRGKLTLKLRSFGGALQRLIPRMALSRTCNYCIYDGGCGVPKDRFRSSGRFVSQWQHSTGSRVVTLNNLSLAPTYQAAADKADYFAGGWVETGTGRQKQMKPIIGSNPVEGGIDLVLLRPLPDDMLTPGQTVVFWPGDNGTFGQCKTKLGNGPRFGGHPFVPTHIEDVAANQTFGGK